MKARKQRRFTALVGAEERRALRAWCQSRGYSLAEGLRHLVVLGLGGSLESARLENERMAVRREIARQHVELAQPGIEFGRAPGSHRGSDQASDYGQITVLLSPDEADRFQAFRQNFRSNAEALRQALTEGKQRVEWPQS